MTLISFLLFSVCPVLAQVSVSPDRQFTVFEYNREFGNESFTVRFGDKVIFDSPRSGYGEISDYCWSHDSKYLALLQRGTKTTHSLFVYHVDESGVNELELPNFRLNLLGRNNQVSGGRYAFDESPIWSKGEISFISIGSLKDGVSNPSDDPENWFRYRVVLTIKDDKVTLREITELPKEEKTQKELALSRLSEMIIPQIFISDLLPVEAFDYARQQAAVHDSKINPHLKRNFFVEQKKTVSGDEGLGLGDPEDEPVDVKRVNYAAKNIKYLDLLAEIARQCGCDVYLTSSGFSVVQEGESPLSLDDKEAVEIWIIVRKASEEKGE